MAIPSILVAVDFGDAAARAVAAGGAIAARWPGAALRLLHAESIEAPAYFTAEQVGDSERQRHGITSQAEPFLSRFGRQPGSATGDRIKSRTAAWTSNHGEPLVRFSPVPILFVPELSQGASR